MTENEKYIYDNFMIGIRSGFLSLDDVIDETLQAVEDEGWEREISEDWVREHITREYKKHETESKTWSRPTDVERLSEVFDKLCREKIVALHNAGYTTSEAVEDVSDVWQDLEDEGINPIGYCYYHGQDLERVIDSGYLYIGFSGKKGNNDKEAIIVGNKVCSALKDAGFTVQWNNTASSRIEVIDFSWQNVYTSDEQVEEKWGYDRVLKLMAN